MSEVRGPSGGLGGGWGYVVDDLAADYVVDLVQHVVFPPIVFPLPSVNSR